MQLITPEEVLGLAFSPDDAIEAAHIRAYRIEAAQLRYIRPAFGEAMYRKMILEQYDSFVSGYIRPALAHYVRYELIGELAVRVSDRGAVRPSAEESEQTTSATRSDQQDRTDTSRQELSRMQVADKTASDTTRRTTTVPRRKATGPNNPIRSFRSSPSKRASSIRATEPGRPPTTRPPRRKRPGLPLVPKLPKVPAKCRATIRLRRKPPPNRTT